jgi:hypothetical protein
MGKGSRVAHRVPPMERPAVSGSEWMADGAGCIWLGAFSSTINSFALLTGVLWSRVERCVLSLALEGAFHSFPLEIDDDMAQGVRRVVVAA